VDWSIFSPRASVADFARDALTESLEAAISELPVRAGSFFAA